jgi:hypothetical protein
MMQDATTTARARFLLRIPQKTEPRDPRDVKRQFYDLYETQLNDCIGERCKEDAAKLPLYTDFFRCDARLHSTRSTRRNDYGYHVRRQLGFYHGLKSPPNDLKSVS